MSADSNPNPPLPRPFGGYELLAEIGSGGMGVIYRARQYGLDRLCAVKMLKVGENSSNWSAQHLLDEARSAASLDHPNIVGIYEVGHIEGQPYFSMELVEGQDLNQFVRGRLISPKKVAAYVLKIAEAIQFAHERGVLHCDLKPANVLIDHRDEPRITDFGLSRKVGRESAPSQGELSGGSPNFMAPEQASARFGSVNVATDVFGIGATLYYLLTDRPPFRGETFAATLQAVLESDPIPPRTLRPGIPVDLETICLKCLEKRRSKRYRTPHEVAEELKRFLNDLPIQARHISSVERAWRLARRRPLLSSLVAATALLILVVSIGSPLSVMYINRALVLAESERTKAQTSERATRRNLYAADMALAMQALSAGNHGRVQELLNRHRPVPGQEDLRGWEWRFLWSQSAPDDLGVIARQDSYIEKIQLLPGGRELLATDGNYHIKTWDLASGKLVRDIRPHSGSGVVFQLDPLGRWLAVTDRSPQATNNSLRILNLATGQTNLEFEIAGFGRPGGGSPDGRLVWMVTETAATAYSVESGKPERTVAFLRENPQRAFDASPDGRWLAWGSDTGGIVLGDAMTGKFVHAFPGHTLHPPFPPAPNVLQFSPDSGLLASGAGDGVVRLWDVNNRRAVGGLTNHADLVVALAFSSDGRTLVSGGRDPFLSVWDVRKQRLQSILHNNSGLIHDILFLPGDRELVSASDDGLIQRWPLRTPERFKPFNDLPPEYGMADFTADGNHFYWMRTTASTGDGGVRPLFSTESLLRFDRSTNILARAFVVPPGGMGWEAEYQYPGAVIVKNFSRSETHQIQLTNWVTLPPGATASAEFAADASRLLISDVYNGVHIFQMPNLMPIRHVSGRRVHVATISRDGKRFAADQITGPAIMGDVATGSLMSVNTGSAPLQGISFSPDGTRIAFVTLVGEVYVCMAETGRILYQLHAPASGLISVSFSPDNTRLAGAGIDGWVCFWDLTSGREIGSYAPHQGVVGAVRFLADGSFVSLGSDGHRRWPSPPLSEIDTKGR